jgi:hypothetical protein
MVAHTGLEPVISALRGQRVNQLHQCAAADSDYRGAARVFASNATSDAQELFPLLELIFMLFFFLLNLVH